MEASNELCLAIDEQTNSVDRGDRLAREKMSVRDQLVQIYRHHNPDKLRSLDDVLKKYQGKEQELLAAVKKKYAPTASILPSQSYVLKNFMNTNKSSLRNSKKDPRWQNQEITRSLDSIKQCLDDMAASIGARCVDELTKRGHRQLIVKPVSGSFNPECKSTVEARVQEMRALIHSRYGKPSTSQYLTNEHDRRESEKQKRKEKQQRQRRR